MSGPPAGAGDRATGAGGPPTGRARPSAAAVAAVAVGGAAGAVSRHGVELLWPSPWGIVAVNVVGALLIGMLMGLLGRGRLPSLARPLLGVGFLGGFTTFSSAMLHLHASVAAGHLVGALLLCVVALIGAVAAAGLGQWLTTRGEPT